MCIDAIDSRRQRLLNEYRLCWRVLTAEFFVSSSWSRLLRVNEIAPRVHNSGTLDHRSLSHPVSLSSISGPSAALPSRRCVNFNAVKRDMTNLIGDDILHVCLMNCWQKQGPAFIIMGKVDIRDLVRKMGHVTRLFPSIGALTTVAPLTQCAPWIPARSGLLCLGIWAFAFSICITFSMRRSRNSHVSILHLRFHHQANIGNVLLYIPPTEGHAFGIIIEVGGWVGYGLPH